MKKLLLSLALMVCFAVTAKADPTAKAIYCSANKTLYFTYDEVEYNTSTAYEALDNKTPTKIYNNISATGYLDPMGGWSASFSNRSNPVVTHSNNTPWAKNYQKNATRVKVLPNFIDWKPTSLSCYFYGMEKLTSFVGAEYINLSNVTSLGSTFFYCKGITDFSFIKDWDVSKVTDFHQTFCACAGITNLDFLKDWDVSNATDLQDIFGVCTNLTDISALDNWKDKVTNVQTLELAFENCFGLTDVDALSNWKFEDLRSLSYTFDSCDGLADIDGLADWDVSKVQDMSGTFRYCSSLENVDALSEWDTGNVLRMDEMFCMGLAEFGDNALANIEGLRNWDTKNVRFVRYMFDGCSHLTTIEPIEGWNMPELRSMTYTFRNCSGIIGRIDLSNWDLSNFERSVEISLWNSISTNYYYFPPLANAFENCSNVIGITLGKGNMGKENLAGNSTNYSGFNNAFKNCPKLRYLDLSGCTDTYGNTVSASRTTTDDMFYTVPRTTVIYLPSGNAQPTTGDLENVVYTDDSELLQCDKYYSENKVDIEFGHRFHADLATYERPGGNKYGAVILPYPVTIQDTDDDEFQPFLLDHEFTDHMYFKGIAQVPANTPFAYIRKNQEEDMTFRMEDLWVESTYDIDGETHDNINGDFAWKAQGFYVTHEIEPEAGEFTIPTMDDYPLTADAAYAYDHVYYLANNRFYRCDNSTLYLDPHRVLFYGMWEKYSGTDPDYAGQDFFTLEETGLVDAINEAEVRMAADKATTIYDASGNRLSQVQKGINILRMADGSVRKVIIK